MRSPFDGHEVHPLHWPSAGAYGFDLEQALSAVVALESEVAGDAFTVELAAGTYSIEWYAVATRETVRADPVLVGDGRRSFSAPLPVAGPAVLYLKRTNG